MANQKTGADALFVALRHICHVVVKYRAKLDAFIDTAVAGSIITSAQGTIAHDFIATATTTCGVFELLATANSLSP